MTKNKTTERNVRMQVERIEKGDRASCSVQMNFTACASYLRQNIEKVPLLSSWNSPLNFFAVFSVSICHSLFLPPHASLLFLSHATLWCVRTSLRIRTCTFESVSIQYYCVHLCMYVHIIGACYVLIKLEDVLEFACVCVCVLACTPACIHVWLYESKICPHAGRMT